MRRWPLGRASERLRYAPGAAGKAPQTARAGRDQAGLGRTVHRAIGREARQFPRDALYSAMFESDCHHKEPIRITEDPGLPASARKEWRLVYVIGAMVALYFNIFVLVAQSFAKVPALKALAPTQSEPPFAVAQGVVLVLFVALTVLAVKRVAGRAAVGRSIVVPAGLLPERKGVGRAWIPD